MFDPSEYEPPKGRRDDDKPRLTRSGRFLVACKWVADHIELSRNDNPFVRTFFHVIDGPQKDHWFREDVFLHENSRKRLASMAHAVGWKKKFDPERDLATLADMLLHRPFSAKVKTENGGNGEVYARLAFSDPANGEAEIEACKAYMREMKEKRAEQLEKLAEAIAKKAEERASFRDDDGGFGGFDDEAPRGGRSGRGSSRSRSKEEAFDDFDDDIPF